MRIVHRWLFHQVVVIGGEVPRVNKSRLVVWWYVVKLMLVLSYSRC